VIDGGRNARVFRARGAQNSVIALVFLQQESFKEISMSAHMPSHRSKAVFNRLLPCRLPRLSTFGSALSLTMLLSACNGSGTGGQTTPKPAVIPTPVIAACQASQSWITRPQMPAEVAATESFCDFYQFSWQWFLAQVSPSNRADPNSERVFESNRVYAPQGGGDQCLLKAITGRAAAIKALAMRDIKPVDFEDLEADGNALYDQNGNILYYNVWYSQAECSATQDGFAPGTMEIKVAWKILPNPDPTYFTMQATLPGSAAPVTLGLVGFHLVNWTSKHPEMIWTTFEHKGNAPLCDGSSTAPASGWSLTSAEAAACLAANKQAAPNISAKCSNYNFNSPQTTFTGTPPATSTPDEICRLYAHGNELSDTASNGNSNLENITAIHQLNTALVGPTGMLTQLPASDPMSVWQNYEMIGGLWTKGGVQSCDPALNNCNLPVTNTYYAADPTNMQRGSLQLTNMTLETFQQGATSQIPNCFGCHNYYPAGTPGQSPLKVSHLAKNLFPSSWFPSSNAPSSSPPSQGATSAPASTPSAPAPTKQ
jgi:hypothetical protein